MQYIYRQASPNVQLARFCQQFILDGCMRMAAWISSRIKDVIEASGPYRPADCRRSRLPNTPAR
jgi:hypothetical protein